jgi:hypothetical protein
MMPGDGCNGQHRADRDDRRLEGARRPVSLASGLGQILRDTQQRRPGALPRPGQAERYSHDGLGLSAAVGGIVLVLLLPTYGPSVLEKPGVREPERAGGDQHHVSRNHLDNPEITGIQRLIVIAPAGSGCDPETTSQAAKLLPEPEKYLREEAAESLQAFIADKITSPGWMVISEDWPVDNRAGFTAAENAMGSIQPAIHELVLGKPAELIVRTQQVPEPAAAILEQVAVDAPLPGDQSLPAIIRGAEVIAVAAAVAAGQYHLACAWLKPLAHDTLTTAVEKALAGQMEPAKSAPEGPTPQVPDVISPPRPGPSWL